MVLNRPILKLVIRLAACCFIPCFGLALLAFVAGRAMPKRTLVFISDQEARQNVFYLMDVSHTILYRLNLPHGASCCPSWSPDGSQLAFVTSPWTGTSLRLLYVEDIYRGVPEVLAAQKGITSEPAWSSDGSHIAFLSQSISVLDNPGVYVVGLADHQMHRIVDSQYDAAFPYWIPRSQTLVFSADYHDDSDIFMADADGGHLRRLTNTPLYESKNLALSPDGQHILFSGSEAGQSNLYLMDTDGSHRQQLTANQGFNMIPSWSPDGRQIVFFSNRDGDNDIYVMNADGSDSRQLTFNDRPDENPAWSPDGQQIVFEGRDTQGWALYVVDADGRNRRRLVKNGFLASWQPG